MSQENVALVVKQFGDTNAGDFTSVTDAWSDDVTLVLHSLTTTVAGKAAVGEWFADWFQQFGSDYRFDVAESRDAGEQVVVVVAHHGTGRKSGVTIEQRSAYVYTVSDGKISRIDVWMQEDARETAIQAAGLSE